MDLTSTLDALNLNAQSLVTAALTSLSGLAIYLGYRLTRKVRAYLTPSPPSKAVEALVSMIRDSDMGDWKFKEGDYCSNYVDQLKNETLDLRIAFHKGKCMSIGRLSDKVTFTQGVTSREKRLLYQAGEECLKLYKEYVIFAKKFESVMKPSPAVNQVPLPHLHPNAQWVNCGHPYPSEGQWMPRDKK